MFSSHNYISVFVDFTDNAFAEDKVRYLNEAISSIKTHRYLCKKSNSALDIEITYCDYNQIFDFSTIYLCLKDNTESDDGIPFKITMRCNSGYTVKSLQTIHKTLSDIFYDQQEIYYDLKSRSVVFFSNTYAKEYIFGNLTQGEALSSVYQDRLNREVINAHENSERQKQLAIIFNNIKNYKILPTDNQDKQNDIIKKEYLLLIRAILAQTTTILISLMRFWKKL